MQDVQKKGWKKLMVSGRSKQANIFMHIVQWSQANVGLTLVSCPAGKIGGKIRLVTLCTILGTGTYSAECNQGVNWRNWSHIEARIVKECTCSSHFLSSELQWSKNVVFLLACLNSCLNVWKIERVSRIVHNVTRQIFRPIFFQLDTRLGSLRLTPKTKNCLQVSKTPFWVFHDLKHA